ncbi:hypothetical protein [Protaetiibacter intestinalis]|uniref:Uncharacterized protein n=1 Tax=Protaetiibacter intestinalis TaxID=2419774 RepID=A0A387B800_9MICO|nr:hypothetical protein [Protaetiibacter intestinalis]AYF98473.1 hypothetical protein D7I47_09530 [Protaetiibacter intestinalis]
MKALLYAGHELLTTDEVADALLDYVVTLPLNQPPERVVIPAVRAGSPVVAELVVTGCTPVAATTTDDPDTSLEGEEYAVQVLRRKTERLAGLGLGLR